MQAGPASLHSDLSTAERQLSAPPLPEEVAWLVLGATVLVNSLAATLTLLQLL